MKRTTLLSGLLAATVALGVAAPAQATTDVLQRSFENMPQGILDSVLAPVTAGQSIYNNLQNIEDTPGVRIAYTVPGYLWNTMGNFGGGVIRTLTGVLELPTGIILLFTDAEVDALLHPVEANESLILYDEYEDIYRVKFGMHYTGG
ncbi:MAG: hypothetical protein ABFS41_04160 [Myxococcota bacterium]